MIVTCPGCTSKYRVRNESVPAEGARMRCPKCETLFLAKPPEGPTSSTEPTTLPPMSMAPGAASVPPALFGGLASGSAPPAFGAHGLFGNSGPVPVAGPGSASTSPFAAPGTNPLGGAFSMPTTGSGAGASASPRTQGPLTAMMQGIDDATLKAAAAGLPPAPAVRSARAARPDEDPFANIILDGGPDTASGAAARAASSLPLRVAHTEPTTQVRLPAARPSLAAEAASWALVTAAGFAALFGVAFAGWTSEALDLDASLLPVFERRFGVTPPRSFIGRDDPAPDQLRKAAESAEAAGDLAGAAVHWLELRERTPEDPAVIAAVPRVLAALGEGAR